jgi:hypothetical protein
MVGVSFGLADSPCAPLPDQTLHHTISDAEIARRELQQATARGWGSWLHRDILSVVLLPDSATLVRLHT